MKKICILLTCLFWLGITTSPFGDGLFAQENKIKNILLLKSYHQGFQWDDNVVKGIKAVFKPINNIDLHIESMDTKRIYTPEHLKNLVNLYQHKFKNIEFDLIITSDDNAFNFIRKYRNLLFPRAPVVFFGVNNFKDEDIQGLDWITGMAETMDIKGTIVTALRLHPKTNTIYVVNDYSTTGITMKESVIELLKDWRSPPRIVFSKDASMDELLIDIEQLPPNTLIYLGAFFRDKAGQYFSFDETTQLIVEHSPVPVYTSIEQYFRNGVVGGNLIKGSVEGEKAASIGKQIIDGTSPDRIPVVKTDEVRFSYDYNALTKWKVNAKLLPLNSVILNQPPSFYENYKTLVWQVVFVIAVLSAFILVLLMNIHKRKQHEEALRESERHYRDLADLLPQTVFELNTKGDITFGNRRGFALFGYSSDDLDGGINVAQIIAPQDRERMLATMRDRVSGIEGKGSECLGLRQDGSSFPALVYASPIERNDEIVGSRCLLIDITDRKQAEDELKQHRDRLEELVAERSAALRQSEQRLALAMDAANDGLWDFNPQTGETYFSPRWYTMLGFQPDEMPPSFETFTALIHPEDRAETLSHIERHNASGEPFSCEFRMRQKDGGYLWILDRGQTREWDEQGRPLRMIGMHTDITERKQAEEDLKEANRELDAFAYTVSHDLRTPLTPIIGYADFLHESCRDRLDEQALDCLAQISASGHKMAALMEDLLTLAKVGQVERPAAPFDAGEVVNEVVCGLAEIIDQAGVSVNVGSLPPLRVPQTLLAQIFDNLIGNAVRYAGREGSSIEVGGEQRGGLVRLYIRDHGPGIPKEERSRIFEVFFRGATGKKSPGTGVGLATVQKIARLYGGRAWVEETEGGGSTFWVEMEDDHSEEGEPEKGQRRENTGVINV